MSRSDLINTASAASPVGKKAKKMGKMWTLVCKAQCLFISGRQNIVGVTPNAGASPAVQSGRLSGPPETAAASEWGEGAAATEGLGSGGYFRPKEPRSLARSPGSQRLRRVRERKNIEEMPESGFGVLRVCLSGMTFYKIKNLFFRLYDILDFLKKPTN